MAPENGPHTEPPVKNVYLTGFMCAGKTLTGKALARLLKRPFYDSDSALEKEHGTTIAGLVRERGLAGFRKAEAAEIKKLAAREGLVAALGGGVYPSPRWKKRLEDTGLTVYLHCPWPELKGRLKAERKGRPLLAGDWTAACERARKLYGKRLGFYRQAQLEVNTAGLTPQAVAVKIKTMLRKSELEHG